MNYFIGGCAGLLRRSFSSLSRGFEIEISYGIEQRVAERELLMSDDNLRSDEV